MRHELGMLGALRAIGVAATFGSIIALALRDGVPIAGDPFSYP